eukprot:TRINITY_DN15896_c0_g1_i3.p1 TRINITY_DN15896_c0_g1~~TRINITY_DN15896_c0_g1_i3.p1  ORF type:complete len:902 (+),score=212.70 TRINITY_DN15896_c0_g1_i3:371-3076(+)
MAYHDPEGKAKLERCLDQYRKCFKVAERIENQRVCPHGVTLRHPETGKVMTRRPTDVALQLVRDEGKRREHGLSLGAGDLRVNNNKQIGRIHGLEVGQRFQGRAEMSAVGGHKASIAGIVSCPHRTGVAVAESIVSSGGYEDDEEHAGGATFWYTGAGGNDHLGSGQQMESQSLTNTGNKALNNSHKHGTPVRVFCATKADSQPKKRSSGTARPHIYIGLYKVADVRFTTGKRNIEVIQFLMERLPQQAPNPLTESVIFCGSKRALTKRDQERYARQKARGVQVKREVKREVKAQVKEVKHEVKEVKAQVKPAIRKMRQSSFGRILKKRRYDASDEYSSSDEEQPEPELDSSSEDDLGSTEEYSEEEEEEDKMTRGRPTRHDKEQAAAAEEQVACSVSQQQRKLTDSWVHSKAATSVLKSCGRYKHHPDCKCSSKHKRAPQLPPVEPLPMRPQPAVAPVEPATTFAKRIDRPSHTMSTFRVEQPCKPVISASPAKHIDASLQANKCLVCCENVATHALITDASAVTCGHLCFCGVCVLHANVDSCPTCRLPVGKTRGGAKFMKIIPGGFGEEVVLEAPKPAAPEAELLVHAAKAKAAAEQREHALTKARLEAEVLKHAATKAKVAAQDAAGSTKPNCSSPEPTDKEALEIGTKARVQEQELMQTAKLERVEELATEKVHVEKMGLWSVDTVCCWLDKVCKGALTKYKEEFRANEMDGEALLLVARAEPAERKGLLQELRVVLLAHQLKLIGAIEAVAREEASAKGAAVLEVVDASPVTPTKAAVPSPHEPGAAAAASPVTPARFVLRCTAAPATSVKVAANAPGSSVDNPWVLDDEEPRRPKLERIDTAVGPVQVSVDLRPAKRSKTEERLKTAPAPSMKAEVNQMGGGMPCPAQGGFIVL